MGDALTLSLVGLLRAISLIYDILAFIPYYLFFNPRKQLQESRKVKVRDFIFFQPLIVQ